MRPPAAPANPLDRLRAAGITGFFRPTQLVAAGLTRDQLPALVRSGKVEHVQRGLYRLADADMTENYSYAMVSARVPNSVICLISALSIHGIGTQIPSFVWLAIPHKARAPRLAHIQLQIVRFSGAAWTYGVQEMEFEGVPVRITSPARTIVDCFRYERRVGTDVAVEALVDGLRERVVTVGQLDRVEKVLPSRHLRAALNLRSIGSHI